MSAGTF